MKHLIKKFGFREIKLEIKEHDWKLPTIKELENMDIEYENIWVADLPPKLEDRETHAIAYNVPTELAYLCNKNFMQNIIVLKKGK